jgi:hypothetical protein
MRCEFDAQCDRRRSGTWVGRRRGGISHRSESDGFEADLGEQTKQFGRGTLAQLNLRDHFGMRLGQARDHSASLST